MATGLWDVEAPTFSRQSAHRWRWALRAGRPLPQGRKNYTPFKELGELNWIHYIERIEPERIAKQLTTHLEEQDPLDARNYTERNNLSYRGTSRGPVCVVVVDDNEMCCHVHKTPSLVRILRLMSSVFWNMMPCSRLSGWHTTSSSGPKSNKAGNQDETGFKEPCCQFHAGLLLDLLFDPEDCGNVLLRNVNRLSPGYMALYPRRQNSSEVTAMRTWGLHQMSLRSFLIISSHLCLAFHNAVFRSVFWLKFRDLPKANWIHRLLVSVVELKWILISPRWYMTVAHECA
jgi:hypothetical protein